MPGRVRQLKFDAEEATKWRLPTLNKHVHAIKKYGDLFPAFADSRECKFVKVSEFEKLLLSRTIMPFYGSDPCTKGGGGVLNC